MHPPLGTQGIQWQNILGHRSATFNAVFTRPRKHSRLLCTTVHKPNSTVFYFDFIQHHALVSLFDQSRKQISKLQYFKLEACS